MTYVSIWILSTSRKNNQMEYFLKYWMILHWTLLNNSKLPTNICLTAVFSNWQRKRHKAFILVQYQFVWYQTKTNASWKLKLMVFIVLSQDTPKQMLGRLWQLCMALNSVKQLSADLKTCSSALKMHASWKQYYQNGWRKLNKWEVLKLHFWSLCDVLT